ncbi:MAG: baseplate J/gp47 family protein [Myxococcales bacterium]|nr:baseplate J/gp47 family protein [Myxococcales bacterium]
MADVLANVWAGSVHMTHGHLEWISQQLFGDTAEREFLIRLAAKYELTITPATFASGTVLATGTSLTNIPSGTILVRDDGETFETTALATISGASVSVPVQAVTAGAIGNMEEDDTLALESPIAGIDSTMTVEADGIVGGIDEEETEDFRERYLLRRRNQSTGGSDEDYEAWALAVAGVTRAWVYRHEGGLGTLTVRFVMDGETSIIPSAGDVIAMQAALDAERPTTAEVTAAAPTETETEFTIELIPDTAAARVTVEAELADLLYRNGIPGDGVARGTILLSQIRTAIGVAEGVEDYTLTLPAADVVPGLGALPVMPGAITWV